MQRFSFWLYLACACLLMQDTLGIFGKKKRDKKKDAPSLLDQPRSPLQDMEEAYRNPPIVAQVQVKTDGECLQGSPLPEDWDHEGEPIRFMDDPKCATAHNANSCKTTKDSHGKMCCYYNSKTGKRDYKCRADEEGDCQRGIMSDNPPDMVEPLYLDSDEECEKVKTLGQCNKQKDTDNNQCCFKYSGLQGDRVQCRALAEARTQAISQVAVRPHNANNHRTRNNNFKCFKETKISQFTTKFERDPDCDRYHDDQQGCKRAGCTWKISGTETYQDVIPNVVYNGGGNNEENDEWFGSNYVLVFSMVGMMVLCAIGVCIGMCMCGTVTGFMVATVYKQYDTKNMMKLYQEVDQNDAESQ